jgi:hypothetical protein
MGFSRLPWLTLPIFRAGDRNFGLHFRHQHILQGLGIVPIRAHNAQ